MNAPENPPAFPVSSIDGFTQHGMALRDYFAGQLAPVCFADSYGNDWGKDGIRHGPRAAARCYAWADAMLTERARNASGEQP